MTVFAKLIAKVIGPKRQWREYKARGRQLPASYRTALAALERYPNYYGRLTNAIDRAAAEERTV